MWVTIILFINGAFGKISKSLQKELEELEIGVRNEILQITAL